MDGLDHNVKPGFALSLSFDGIALLHRAAGGWRLVGEVALDSGDLPSALNDLRDKADLLEPGNLACKLIIPNDQIRYLTLETGDLDREGRELLVIKALEGATPYQVEDLVFDLSQDGEQTHVAAVARETLEEAEAFAAEHGFNPTSFVAVPGDNAYLGEPFFGPATAMGGLPVPPDGIAVVIIGPAIYPEDDADDMPAPEPSQSPEEEVTAEDVAAEPAPLPDPAPFVGFSSRRGKPDQDKAPDSGDKATVKAKPVAPPPPETPEAVSPPKAAPTVKAPASPAAPFVSAPTLDIPPPAPQDAPAVAAAEPSGFHSSRTPPPTTPPAPRALPASPPPPEKPTAQLITEGDDETVRMTLFGSRDQVRIGGKPKHLGLILTAALLLFMAAIAALAMWSTDLRLSDLFGADPAEKLTAPAEPEQAEPAEQAAPEADTAPAQAPAAAPEPPAVPAISSLPAPVQLPEPAPSETPEAPALTDTDIAVLDALREPVAPDPATDIAVPAPAAEADSTAATDAARYAATGIWPVAPEQTDTPGIISLNDLYVASIDRTDLSRDAIALQPADSLKTDIAFAAPGSPAPAGTVFKLDAAGLVTPTPEGALNPEGVRVFLGRPPVVPPVIPARLETAPETDTLRTRLAGYRPRLRPENLSEQVERSRLGGLSQAELSLLRPRLRPESVQTRALARLQLEQEARQDQQAEQQPDPQADALRNSPGDVSTATALAVTRTLMPKPRPQNMAAIVNNADRSSTARTAAVAPATVSPKIPSSASVARQATFENALNLKRVNLIGVYGTPSNRRALVRLPSGRYKKVKVGDKVDGGKVVAIGDSTLRYQKKGRNLTLKIPNG